MLFKLMTLVHVCAAFPLKCPEPAQWRLRANGHCVNPSKYFCLRNDIINGYSENCTKSDFQQAGRKSVLRGGIDAVVCSKERYQPSGYTLYTNASTNCILLKSVCNEAGQVVYDHGNRTSDATCRCNYRQGFAFLIKPNNPCFCKPSQEDCSCFLKICSNSSHILSPDYKCTINSDLHLVTHCRAITDENDNSGRKPDVKETFLKEDNVSVFFLEPWKERSVNALLSIFGGTLTLVLFILVICIRQFKAFENNGPGPELNLIEGDTLTLQYMLPIKRLSLCFFKDDTLIAETVNVKKHVLEKTNVTLGDQGYYFAKVFNIRSRITKVTVQSMFTSEFNTIKCIEGELLQLKCSVYSEDINVEWSKVDAKDKENTNISIQIDGRDHCMTIQQAQLSDAGQYLMVAGNVRKQVTVTVEAMFTSEHKHIKCVEGETLQLKCSVYSEDINVGWLKDDARFRKNENTSIEIDGKDHCLAIQQAKLSDAGLYMMVAANVRKQVTVTVEAMFTSEFNPIKCIEGETLQMTCSVFSEYVFVEWYKDDVRINDNENILIVSDGMHHCMTIQHPKLSDAGQYIIVAGNVRKQVTVNVEAMFTSEFNSIKCTEGDKLQLTCSVNSEDVFVEWYKRDVRINDNENILIESDGMHHCMTIQQAKLCDAGQYIIVAGNVRKQVTVNVEAMFTSEFNPIKCIEGEKLQLTCSVYSEDVYVEWYKADVRINDNENISIESDGMHHCMTIQQAKLLDAGQYIIVAGNVRKQVTVNVEVLPVSINRLHEKDRRRYIELMQSSEMEKRYYVRIMIVGKESVGKTCLVRRLLKESIDDVTSTDGIDITVHQCKIDIDDGKWMIDKYKADDKVDRIKRALKPVPIENRKIDLLKTNTFLGIDHELSNALSSRASNEEFINVEVQAEDQDNMTNTETTYMVDKTSKQPDVDTNINMKDDGNVLNTDKLDASIENKDTNKSLTLVMPSDLMSRVFSTTSTSTIPSNHYALCGLWDFAGQQEFYATHQAFLTSSAIYLLVADMADDISKQDLKQGFTDFKHVGEYVDFWFDTIHCHQTYEQPVTGPPSHSIIDPPVILVFTGKDKYEKEVEKRRKELQIQLDTVLGYQSKYHHLREIVCLSNKTDQDLKFEELQHKISTIVMGMENWGQLLPLKWILLEHLIDINKNDGKKFINFSDMVNLAKHRDILILDNEDLKLFLRFQHEVGNIIYFEDVEDFIILDPKWLVDAFRCLVSHKIDDKLQHRVDWTVFVRSGKISESLISELFKSKCGNKFSGQIENLLKVMEKFDILVKIGDTRLYIMPSMMPSASFDRICKQIGVEQPNCQRTSWLCLKFSFLPPAFFNHISVWFIRKYDPSKMGNTIKSLELFRGICVFDIDKFGCEKLLVTMSSDTIAIQLLSFSTRKPEFGSICINIRKDLMEKVASIKDRYKLTISCDIHFKCSTGHYFEDTVSYKDLKSSIEYYCNQHKGVHQSEQTYSPWITNADDDLEQQEIPDLNDDIIDDSELSPRAAEKTRAELEVQCNVRGPPAASHLRTVSSSSAFLSQDLPIGGPPSDIFDELDIPVDQYVQCLEGWPSSDTYSLNMIKKTKKYLDVDFLSDRTYDTDQGRECRVLCILNKTSGDKVLYQGTGGDVEQTYLQQMKKQFKWNLRIHRDKTSAEICEILDNEMSHDFTVNHSLFVIIISRGDKYGMFGTYGERIEYWAITTRFDQVPSLKGKPKIFILDDCDIGTDIHAEAYSTAFTNPEPLIRTVSGRELFADQRDSVLFETKNLDTYICKASTMGRCDSVVKGSWVLGALWSVMCKAANYMTFTQMMRQVQLVIEDANIPEGKPDPDMTITNDLTKDFYMLPPPS